jgi:hypothetical protein
MGTVSNKLKKDELEGRVKKKDITGASISLSLYPSTSFRGIGSSDAASRWCDTKLI